MTEQNAVDEAGLESFPANDAPGWTVAPVGPPARGEPGSTPTGQSLPKSLTDIRLELLAQHASLKSMAARARILAGSPPGPTVRSELAGLLYTLGDGIDAHNTHEEQLLADVLPTIDAWGSVRVARMDEQHREEHRRIADRIRAAAELTDFSAIVRTALPAIDEFLDRMRQEEEDLLSPDVLRDDVVSIDQFDG